MASESLIVLDSVVKRFPGAFVLGPISLSVERRELLAVLGPSGCGKTTLLRLIAGFERPDAGSLVIEGRIVAGRSQWVEPEDRQVGMVFQDYALFPHLTVAHNVSFGMRAPSPFTERARVRWERGWVRELLQFVGLAGFEDRYPHELSGGEQQRVALARALAANPRVLLLDEPFSNLDADLRPKMRAELAILLHRINCTTIFVTHDQEEAFELADRVAVLNAGRLEQIDTPERLYREPATRFVAEFIGHADFLTGRARGNCVETALGCFAKPPSVPEGAIVAVMLRPEEIELSASSLPLLFPHPHQTPPPSLRPLPRPLPDTERGGFPPPLGEGSGERSGKGAGGLGLEGKGDVLEERREGARKREAGGEGLIVARRYRGGMQLITVRLSSGESVRSLQPAGAHFPLASRVRVRVKADNPPIFLMEANGS
ncbi:MAG: ABC transporter ATP-binding protein [Candidatus Bipolaricaulota bacterium]|nr:ABC transporter ATP-binding protein [Candidatus Bipolaricaulota bacterium]